MELQVQYQDSSLQAKVQQLVEHVRYPSLRMN